MEENLNNTAINPTYSTPYDVDLPKPGYDFKEYTRKVLSLPQPIKDLMMDFSTAEFVEENLGPQFEFSAEQKTVALRIIRDVLLGEISINSMVENISEKMEVDPTTAYQIQGKIVSDLFGQAVEDIKNMQSGPEIPKARPSQPKYAPPQQEVGGQKTVPPGNVVDLRNRNNNQ